MNRIISMLAVCVLIGCGSLGDQFEDGIAAISGKGGTISRVDAMQTSEYQVELAMRFNTEILQVGSDFSVDFPYDDADFIIPIDKTRLVVGGMTSDSYLGRPEFSNVVMYDIENGQKLWERNRPNLATDLGSYQYLQMQTKSLLIGSEFDRFLVSAFETDTGNTIWEFDLKGVISKFITEDAIFVANKIGNKIVIEKRSLDTGKPIWSKELEPENYRSSSLAISELFDISEVVQFGEYVLFSCNGVYALSADTGDLFWFHGFTEGQGVKCNLVPTETGVICWNSIEAVMRSWRNGSVAWQIKQKFEIQSVSLGVNETFLVSEIDEDKFEIQCIRNTSGDVIWSREFDSRAYSNLLVYGNSLIFTTVTHVYFVSLGSGKVLSYSLPEEAIQSVWNLEFVYLLPDVLVFRFGNIVISRDQYGVLAIDPSNRDISWDYSIRDSIFADTDPADMPLNVTSGAYTYSNRHRALDSWTKTKGLVTFSDEVFKSKLMFNGVLNALDRQIFDSSYRWKAVYNNTRGSSVEHIKYVEGMLKMNRSFEMAADVLRHGVAINNALALVLEVIANDGAMGRMHLQINHGLKLHLNAIRGRYFVRPYLRKMHAICALVVDLETGKKVDFLIGINNGIYDMFGVNLLTCGISADGTFTTVNVSTDSASWNDQVKWKHTIPMQSLMKFDVDRMFEAVQQ